MKKGILMAAAALLFCSALSYGWGFFGHKVVNQLAIYSLTGQLQEFYYKHQDYLVQQSVRPDERRNTDPAEAPRHFINIDVYGEDAVHTMPEGWEAAAARYTPDTLLKYGIVPWHVVVMKERLTNAFRQKNLDSVLYYSADLGHYMADAHVPLHITMNYDGQLTDQRGLHSLWESKVPEAHAQTYKLKAAKAQYVPDMEKEIWRIVRETYQHVDQTLALEREVSKDFTQDTKFETVVRDGRTRQYYTPAFVKAYEQKLGTMVEDQMRSSAQHVANFWYSCWVDAGRPNLIELHHQKLTKPEKKELKKELKAWKKNQLFQENLVIAARKN